MGTSHRLDILRSGLKREHTGSHNFSNEGGLEVLVCSLAEELLDVCYFEFLNFTSTQFFVWGYTHPPFSPRVCGAANPTVKSRGGAWEWLLTQPICCVNMPYHMLPPRVGHETIQTNKYRPETFVSVSRKADSLVQDLVP